MSSEPGACKLGRGRERGRGHLEMLLLVAVGLQIEAFSPFLISGSINTNVQVYYKILQYIQFTGLILLCGITASLGVDINSLHQ